MTLAADAMTLMMSMTPALCPPLARQAPLGLEAL